jgi:magnesium transporter
VTEIVEGVEAAERERIRRLRESRRFFWIDVALSETSRDELGEALGVPGQALERLLDFGTVGRSRTFYADGQHVVFAFSCYVESAPPAQGPEYRLHPVKVHVLVSGNYLLTLHEERLSLPGLLAPDLPEGRSAQFAVYSIIDAMVSSAFEALTEAEERLEELQLMETDLRAGRVRMERLRAINSRLSEMRRRLGPYRGSFERISVEIGRLEGLQPDTEPLFERIGEQVNRLVEAIDADADAMARLIDLRLNETTYWLTVVATIFLPLTFLTGFFGMNFNWMVDQVDSPLAFWLLGVGSLVVGVALILRLVVRGAPLELDEDTTEPVR